MKRLFLILILLGVGFNIFNYFNTSPIPQFTDEENLMICIEEGIL